MTEKQFNSLKRAIDLAQYRIQKYLQQEAMINWNGFNTNKLREMNESLTVASFLAEKLKIEKKEG